MNDPAIEANLKRWMPRIIRGNRRALKKLMRAEWMLLLLYRIAEWAERRKKIEVDEERGNDIQEIITERIRAKLHLIKNSNHVPWSKCIPKWCYVVAANLCEDIRKRNAHFLIDREVDAVSLTSTLPSPEEELERKEQAPIRKKLKLKIPTTAVEVRDAAAPDERQILSLWVEGCTLKRIAEETSIPLSTVQRKLKKIQKAIVGGVEKGISEEVGEKVAKESGVVKVLQKVVQDRAHMREL